jgi:hypothetical protein
MRTLVLVATLALLAGCATETEGGAAAPAVGSDLTDASGGDALTHFILRFPGGQEDVIVLVNDTGVTGPRVQLSRYVEASDHAIRGTAFRSPVDIQVTAEGVKGVYGGGIFDIKITLAGDALEVHGTVSGQPTAFQLGPHGLLGHVGRCMYQLQRVGNEFSGTRGCGAGVGTATMSFPAAFGKWSIAEMAATLSILLSAQPSTSSDGLPHPGIGGHMGGHR